MTVTLSPKEIKVIKCNGVGTCKKKKHNMYTIPPDYLSHIVVIGELLIFIYRPVCDFFHVASAFIHIRCS